MFAVQAIEKLNEQGHQIIYSNRLVPAQLIIDIDNLSMPALGRALAIHRLRLERAGRRWIIVQGGAALFNVSGKVINADGQPVARAKVSAATSESVLAVDNNGRFELKEIQLGEVITVSATGYEIRSTIIESEQELVIALQQEQRIENVIVYGSPYRLNTASTTDSLVLLNKDELRLAPAFGGDSLRVVNKLPGMSSVGVSARPRIRGGTPEEVLILLDGVELLEPFHLADYQGGFSSIDSSTVGSIEVYTGGFPVRYGNRMSGVIEIQADSLVEDYGTQLGYSNYSATANTRGAITGDNTGNWIVSVREGDLEELTQFLDARASDPEYRDAMARLSLRSENDSTLTLGGLYAEDDIRFNDESERASSEVSSHYFWLRLDSENGSSNRATSSSWLLSSARLDRDKDEYSEVEEDGKGGDFNYSQDSRHIVLRNDRGLKFGSNLLEYGFQLSYSKSRYSLQSAFNRSDLANNLGGIQFFNAAIDTEPEGVAAGVYLAGEWANNYWTIQPSLRADWYDYESGASDEHLSPRLGLTYHWNSDFKTWITAGRYYQPQGLHELQVIDGVERFNRPQSSDQAVLGSQWYVGDATIKAETYYKRYRNPAPRFENLFNPFVLLPELEPDRIRLAPDKARASGFDFELNYDVTLNLKATLRYSYMEAKDRINNTWVSRRWSQRNSASGQLGWQNDSWSVALGAAWHSGWRSAALPGQIASTDQLAIEDVLNQVELDDYFSLDFALEKTWRAKDMSVSVSFDGSNISDRKNLAGIDFDAEDDAGQITFEEDRETLLPYVYSLGLIIAF
jgi:hypothetical protein